MPLSDDQYRAIGRISAEFNTLELATNFFVWALVNEDDLKMGRLALEGEQFSPMLERVTRLSRYIFQESEEQLNPILQWVEQARDVLKRRNAVIHAQWTLDEPKGEMVGLRLLGKAKSILEVEAGANELNRLADDITRVRRELMRIMETAVPSVATWAR